jgi:HK97 family phage major capsid protein
LWPSATHVPVHALAITVTSGFMAGTVGESGVKPASALALSGAGIAPVKVAGFVAATDELFRMSDPAAAQLFDNALRQAVTIAGNVRLLTDLIALTTPIPSSGTSAGNVLTDLGALLETIQVGENSKLFFVLSGDDAKALATKTNAAGVLAFPRLNLSTGGEILPGITAIISNALPPGAALLIDAAGLLLGDEGLTLDGSRQASLQLESAPDSPATASTVMISLWSSNMQALRCERIFAYAVGRPGSLASLSGVDY